MITPVGSVTYEFRGLSTDQKPTGKKVGNGSIFFEMDTLAVYMYDEENNAWIKLETK